ncbi:MAG: mechanosensitive ion channel family protein [Candidatus Falkowbacteria bacterium]
MFDFQDLINSYPFLQVEFLGNSTFDWIFAILVFFAIITVLKIFKTIVISRMKAIAKKTKTEIDDIVIGALNAIHWPFYVFVSFYFALHFLETHSLLQKWSYYIFLIAIVYYAIQALQEFINFGAGKMIGKKGDGDEHDIEFIKILSLFIKIFLWVGAIVLVLSNMGYNVTSLIAGLGIGGIAIALALQNILGDLFSSFVIYFDKPFKIGDFIIIGDTMGTVRKVGVKTTRIQSLSGEEIVMSNNELTKMQVRNFGVMERRRIVFNIGVTYDTSANKLKKIPDYIKNIIKEKGGEQITIDRIHFKTFGDSSLIFEVVYFVESGNYATYMDIQEAVNLSIIDKFEKENIIIAYPTQTVYIKKD